MASVYRRKFKTPDGRTDECSRYSVECKVGDGFKRLVGYADKRASEELGRKIERLAALQEQDVEPDAALVQWLKKLPTRIRDRLARWELLDGRTVASAKPLTEHLKTYRQALLDGGASPRQKGPATPQHAELTHNRVKAVLDGIGARFVSDVTGAKVTRYLADRREKSRQQGGISVKSSNHYLTAAKALLNWMVREKLTTENPLAHVPKLQVTDRARKYVRRALEPDEAARLLDVAGNAPERFGMTGTARRLLYQLAVETGLRASEVKSLTRASFTLDGPEPNVYLPGDDTKNRQQAVLPLKHETAAELREFLADKLPAAQAFVMPPVEHLAAMLREDLADAEIPYEDEAGHKVDFHSLRVTFVTLLAAAGVPIRTVQTLARHSTPVLTMNVYARTLHGSEADAVNRLPDFSRPARKSLRATGTDSATPIDGAGGRTGGNCAQNRSSPCPNVHNAGKNNGEHEGSLGTVEAVTCGESSRTALNWARKDSNLRRHTPTGLQPVPFGHSGTRPMHITIFDRWAEVVKAQGPPATADQGRRRTDMY